MIPASEAQYYLTNAPVNENSAEGTTGNYIVESLDNGESSQYMEWYYTINANGNLVRKDPYLRSTPVDGSVYSQRCDED